MRRLRAAILALLLIGAGSWKAVWAGMQNPHPSPMIVLVELFTAEGCSSCPPADKLLEAMMTSQPTPGVEIVGLGEHVDYWNALGWKDRFSSASFTHRQQEYGDRLEGGNIYTPQMIVDGVTGLVGSNVAAARAAIEKAGKAPHGRVRLELAPVSEREIDVTATVDALPSADASDIVVAIAEDGLRSDVKRGENAGKVLTHAAVVRSMAAIGQVNATGGHAQTRLKIAPDWRRDRLRVVAFVQERRSRRVLATAAAAAPSSKNSAPELR